MNDPYTANAARLNGILKRLKANHAKRHDEANKGKGLDFAIETLEESLTGLKDLRKFCQDNGFNMDVVTMLAMEHGAI